MRAAGNIQVNLQLHSEMTRAGDLHLHFRLSHLLSASDHILPPALAPPALLLTVSAGPFQHLSVLCATCLPSVLRNTSWPKTGKTKLLTRAGETPAA